MVTASSHEAWLIDTRSEPAQSEVVLPFVGNQAKVKKSGMITTPSRRQVSSWAGV